MLCWVRPMPGGQLCMSNASGSLFVSYRLLNNPNAFLHDMPQIFGGAPFFAVQQKPHTQPHLPAFICQLTIPQLPPGSDGRDHRPSLQLRQAPRRWRSSLRQSKRLGTSAAVASLCPLRSAQHCLQAPSSSSSSSLRHTSCTQPKCHLACLACRRWASRLANLSSPRYHTECHC